MARTESSSTMSSPSGSMNPNDEHGALQIIDASSNFTTELETQMNSWGLSEAKMDYHTVSIFGSQSSGKSTLLNHLFGMDLEVMQGGAVRSQTTKGIWMCRAQGKNLLLMDVEGADGREKAKEKDFERKSAIFSLACSEIVVINLWENQVGLQDGANMSLLQTVFEVNLKLFGSQDESLGAAPTQKTLLLFIIRDVCNSPLSVLEATLFEHLQSVWLAVLESHTLEPPMSDYFDLEFIGLPHMKFLRDQFDSDVQNLGQRFKDSEHPNYLFESAYHRQVGVDELPIFMKKVWTIISENKDLDFFDERKLLVEARLNMIVEEELKGVQKRISAEKNAIVEGRNWSQDLPQLLATWVATALTSFDRRVDTYANDETRKTKRKKLDAALTLEGFQLRKMWTMDACKKALEVVMLNAEDDIHGAEGLLESKRSPAACLMELSHSERRALENFDNSIPQDSFDIDIFTSQRNLATLTIRQAFASLRCRAWAMEAILRLRSSAEVVRLVHATGAEVKQLARGMRGWRADAMASYEQEAPNLDSAALNDGRAAIEGAFNSTACAAFRTQCRNGRLSRQAKFAQDLKTECGVFTDFRSKLTIEFTEKLRKDYSQIIEESCAHPEWKVFSSSEQTLLEEFIQQTVKERDSRMAWRVSTSGLSTLFE